MSLRKTAIIPARYASTRLPGKLMQDLGGKPLIVRTYEAVCRTGLFDEVAVVCDHSIIYDCFKSLKAKVFMSKKEHSCGTDRIAEAVHWLPFADIVVNVQGDEPFTEKGSLERLLAVFEQDGQAKVEVASLMHRIREEEEIHDPNQVKVVVDRQQNALLFSRSPIPYHRNKAQTAIYYKHIGIYAFRREVLQRFGQLAPSPLEQMEQLENLRLLENGIPVRMVLTPYAPIGIDTAVDLEKARKLWAEKNPDAKPK